MMAEFDEFESLFDDEPEDKIEDEKIVPAPEDQQLKIKKTIEKKAKPKRKSPKKPKILTVNSLFEEIINYTEGKSAKTYERINKILSSHDKNRNYQSNILRDLIEILIEMGRLLG